MKNIWVLGAGQLGAMLRQAGTPMGLTVKPIAADQALTDLNTLQATDIVTPEIEAWEQSKVTEQLAQHPNFINRDVFPVIADRLTQKQTLDRLGVATAKWQLVADDISTAALHDSLGDKVLLKRRRGGYDGRGQHWLNENDNDTIPADFYNQSIAEQGIQFSAEVSIIGVRNREGTIRFYPLAHNHHVAGILKASIGAAEQFAHLQASAESMLTKVLQGLDYIGVMAMECFVVVDANGDQQLMVNELAPRVHNSGHWTQAGSSINQFESHLRAVADLPLGTPVYKGVTVMINLVGMPYNAKWLEVPGAEIYWYGKAVRAGRKLGHINFCLPTAAALDQLAALLPEADHDVIEWVKQQLTPFFSLSSR